MFIKTANCTFLLANGVLKFFIETRYVSLALFLKCLQLCGGQFDETRQNSTDSISESLLHRTAISHRNDYRVRPIGNRARVDSSLAGDSCRNGIVTQIRIGANLKKLTVRATLGVYGFQSETGS